MLKIETLDTVAEVLVGHDSFATAFVVENYPYGFHYKTTMRYWVETKKGNGQRLVTQTVNPKTNRLNAVKTSTYSTIVVLYKDKENGHVQQADLSTWDTVEVINGFVKTFEAAFQGDKYRQDALAYIQARKKVDSTLVWTVVTETEANRNEPHQTLKEQAEIIHRLTVNEMLSNRPKLVGGAEETAEARTARLAAIRTEEEASGKIRTLYEVDEPVTADF